MMGMFDWVNAPPITCDCGAEVSGWQTKDGWCDMDLVEPEDIDRYYASCRSCGMWHAFTRGPADPRPPFHHSKRPKTEAE